MTLPRCTGVPQAGRLRLSSCERVDIASKSITDLGIALSPDLGLIRFCSAFMAGPEQGFPKYTFLVNEESNDLLEVPDGAPYGTDPSVAPLRQAGYSAYLDTTTGKVGVLAPMIVAGSTPRTVTRW